MGKKLTPEQKQAAADKRKATLEAKKVKAAEVKAAKEAAENSVKNNVKKEEPKPIKTAQAPNRAPGTKMVKVKGLVNSTLKDGCNIFVGEETEISEGEYQRLQKDPRGMKYCELVR